MKHLLLFLFALLTNISIGFTQDFTELKDFPLQDKEDYSKAEPKVLECANYLLSNPMDDKNRNRLLATQFIIRWMSGTPGYMFTLDKNITDAVKSDVDLMGLAMACMTKFALENKEKASDTKEVTYNSLLLLLDYSEKPENNVTLHKELKKMIKAKNEGKLKEFLKIDK